MGENRTGDGPVCEVFTTQTGGPMFYPKNPGWKSGLVVTSYNPTTEGAETRGSWAL